MLTPIALPYELNALEPYVSEKTMHFHFDKHYKTYVENLNKLIINTELEHLSLENIILRTAEKPDLIPIFNNAGQVYNHQYFFNAFEPKQKKSVLEKITAHFETYDSFKEIFKKEALALFGSGWVWLTEDKQKQMRIVLMKNADNPVAHGLKPLFVADVWEHAYYLDYQNRRAEYIDALLECLKQ